MQKLDQMYQSIGLSCFTLKQNSTSQVLIRNLHINKDKNATKSDSNRETIEDESVLIKSANKQIKSTLNQANKIVCNQEDFHLLIHLSSPDAKFSQPIDLNKNW